MTIPAILPDGAGFPVALTMRVAVVYVDVIPERLLQLLGGCAATETGLFNGRRTDDDFLSRWKPDVVLYHLENSHCERLARWMFSHARHSIARVPAFSFSTDANLLMRLLSEQIGFIAHLEATLLTARELELHLSYGIRLAAAGGGIPATSFDQAFEAVTSFHSTLDENKVIETAMYHLPRMVTADGWAFYLAGKSDKRLELVATVNPLGHLMPVRLEVSDTSTLIGQALADDRPIVLPNTVLDMLGGPVAAPARADTYLVLPLRYQETLLGMVLACVSADRPGFSQSEVDVAERVSASLAVALSNAVSYARAESLCQLDDLTGLYNARFFYQALESEVKRSRRYGLSIAVIFLDLDSFKAINDEFGHLVGSATLVEVAQVLSRLVRETDIVARYGGDEFIIALPETTAVQAAILAERIRARIAAHTFQAVDSGGIHVTCSMGIGAYPEHAATTEDLIKAADGAMYVAKQTLKNRVAIAPERSGLCAEEV